MTSQVMNGSVVGESLEEKVARLEAENAILKAAKSPIGREITIENLEAGDLMFEQEIRDSRGRVTGTDKVLAKEPMLKVKGLGVRQTRTGGFLPSTYYWTLPKAKALFEALADHLE